MLGRRSDVLAWNRTGHALFAGHLDPDSPEQPARRRRTGRARPGTRWARCGSRSANTPTIRSRPS
ncbi:hypothetical protein ACFWD7_19220 [Streptomyces mirabilis]|uniref:hypothetical protein n=1 Tax=Streptomyces mirabilis TaxID=68239 RepID=UPI0021C1DFF7|nr:hypothetical protein [Streptomyces mirabilis]MCT9104286.1 hypothetical protein [Streptomyces mirabilis]